MASDAVSQSELAARMLNGAGLPLNSLHNLALLGGTSAHLQLPDPKRFTALVEYLFAALADRVDMNRQYWLLYQPRRKPVENDTPLVRFLVEEEQRLGLSRRAHALAIGLAPACYYALLREPGQLPTQATLDVLRAHFGDRLPDTRTETERRSRAARANLELFAPAAGTAEARDLGRRAAARSAQLRRGQAMPSATREKIGETRRRTLQRPERIGDRLRLRDYMRTPEGRALGSLTRLLEWSAPGERHRTGPRSLPQTLAEGPSRRQWREHAATVGDRVGMRQEAVLRLWTPRLEELGLWSTRGRKPLLQRFAIVTEFREAWPAGKRGFWPAAHQKVIDVMGRPGSPAGADELRIWFTRFERQHYGKRREPDRGDPN